MIFAEIGKFVGGRVLTAALVVASLAAGYWFYRHPEQLEQLWHVVRNALVWLGVVLVLPWAAFGVITWVVRRESNVAGAVLLLGLTGLDALLAFYLLGWQVDGALTWMVLVLGFLCAGVYNFLICDFQASRLEGAV